MELRKEIETRERNHTAATSERALSEDEVLVPTTGTFLTTTDQGACKVNYQTKGKNCVYCNGSHRSDKCDKIKTVEERLAFFQQHKRCLNCAGFKHSSNRCKSKGRCLKCKRKHHTSICKMVNNTRPNWNTTGQHKKVTTNQFTQAQLMQSSPRTTFWCSQQLFD